MAGRSEASGPIVVADFFFPYQAHLARAALESAGIPAWIYDEHQVQVRWWIAQAIGGVKIAVLSRDLAEAREILRADGSESVREATRDLFDADAERCGRCGGQQLERARVLVVPREWQWVSMLLLLMLGAAAPERRHEVRWSCSACGHTWSSVQRG